MSTRLVPTCSWVSATAADLQPPSTAGHEEREHCTSLSVPSRILLGLCAQALPESVQSKSIPSCIPVVLGHYPKSKSFLSGAIPRPNPSPSPLEFLDGLPTSSNPYPSILPPLCSLMGKTGCPPRTMLSIKPSQVTSHCSGISESESRVSSFSLTSLHGFQTISSPAVLQHFCGSESQAIWCTFFQPSSNFLLALPFICHLTQYTLFQWLQLWTPNPNGFLQITPIIKC